MASTMRPVFHSSMVTFITASGCLDLVEWYGRWQSWLW